MEQMRTARGVAARPVNQETIYGDFHPSSDWTHDPNCHVLLVDLPGFKKEELRVRVDNSRKVTISGERKVAENVYQRFSQVFEMPEDSDIDNISGRFDGGLLFIIIPKKTVLEEKLPENESITEKKDEKRAHEEIPRKDTVKEQHHPEMPKKDAAAVKEQHHPEMPKKDTVKEQHHPDMPNKDAPKEQHHPEMPKNNVVNEQQQAPDLQSEKKAETRRNSEQQGLRDDGTYKMGTEKKEESDRTGWKEGLIRDKMPKMEEGWRKITEKVKNKEEMEVPMRSAMEKIRQNKTVIVTAVIAFSIGVYISRKFHSGGGEQ